MLFFISHLLFKLATFKLDVRNVYLYLVHMSTRINMTLEIASWIKYYDLRCFASLPYRQLFSLSSTSLANVNACTIMLLKLCPTPAHSRHTNKKHCASPTKS